MVFGLPINLSLKAVESWRQAGATFKDGSDFFKLIAEVGKSIPNDVPPTRQHKATKAIRQDAPCRAVSLISHAILTLAPFQARTPSSFVLLGTDQPMLMRGLLVDHLSAIGALALFHDSVSFTCT